MNSEISIPKDAVAAVCRHEGIQRLAIFGSALRLRHILEAARCPP